MKRAASRRLKNLALLTAFVTLVTFAPASAATFFSNITTSTCAGYGMTTSLAWANSITTPAATIVSTVEYKMANSNALTGSRVQIRSSSGSTPSSTVLGTLNYSSLSGNIGTYTGSVSLPAAGTYWFVLSSPTQSISPCYSTSIVTTGTASGWSVGTTAYESNNSGSTFATNYPSYYFLFTVSGSGGVIPSSSSISITTNALATFRTSASISALLGVAGSDGRVTYFANGKKIAGCISIPSSGLTSTCNWRPSRIGPTSLTARLVPTDSAFAPSSSPAFTVRVNARTNIR